MIDFNTPRTDQMSVVDNDTPDIPPHTGTSVRACVRVCVCVCVCARACSSSTYVRTYTSTSTQARAYTLGESLNSPCVQMRPVLHL